VSEPFDPYRTWLGIPAEEQPPNHYRLLGLALFADDPAAIERAAEQRVGILQAFQSGEHGKTAVKLLNEVAQAKVCLLNPNRKAGYDAGVRRVLRIKEEEAARAAAAETEKAAAAQRALCTQFLAVLEEKDLLPGGLLESLRKQTADARKVISAETVAKGLIEKGHLTPALAKRLMAAAEEKIAAPVPAPSGAPREKTPPSKREQEDPGLAPLQEEEELGLAPLEEEQAKPAFGHVKEQPPAATPTKEKRERQPAGRPRQPAGQQPKQVTRPKQKPQAPTAQRPTQPAKQKPAQPPEKTPSAKPVEKPSAAQPAAPVGSLIDEELPPLAEEYQGPTGTGPLDGLLSDASLDAAVGSPLAPAVPKKKKGLKGLFTRQRKKRDEKANVWDSSLLLVGGGALLVLVILGVILVLTLGRETGNDAWEQADGEYRDGNWRQAIDKYTQFIEKFSSHPRVGEAWVKRGLARLREVTPKGTTNWTAALVKAREVLAEISVKEEFKDQQGDASGMLLTIAEGLAGQAREGADPALLGQAEQAVELHGNYVAERVWDTERLARLDELMNLARLTVECGEKLEEAIGAMLAAGQQGNTEQAYRIRKDFLKRYAGLAEKDRQRLQLDSRLREAAVDVSRAQRTAVRWVEKKQPADTTPPDMEPEAAVALAGRITTGEAPDVAGHVVYAAAGGAVYGLDATTGNVLWRWFLGFDVNVRGPGFPPTPISEDPDSDVLLVGPDRQELLCLRARCPEEKDRLHWRFPLGEPFDAHPVINGDRILLATRSGRLVMLDGSSGDSTGYLQLPQELRVAPAVDPRRGWIFQVAEHSDLFVLELDEAGGRCHQVVHLEHEPGSITVPPVLIAVPPMMAHNLLLVTENDRSTSCRLRVFRIEQTEEGLSATEVQQPFRLAGNVNTAPLVEAQKVLVVSDTGAVSIFKLTGTDNEARLTQLGRTVPGDQKSLLRFPLIRGDHFWIADDRLTKYEILGAYERRVFKWTTDEHSVFQQPPRIIAETLFHVRRTASAPGVIVTAMATLKPEEIGEPPGNVPRYWETRLAAPPAAAPMPQTEDGKITVVTTAGELYRIDSAGVSGPSVIDQPSAVLNPVEVDLPVTDAIRLGAGARPGNGDLLVLSRVGQRPTRIAVFDLQRHELLDSLLLQDTLACSPVALGGGLLAPCTSGQVHYLDPRSGKKLSEPFEPAGRQAGVEVLWRLPGVAGAKEVVLSDGRTGLYLATVEDGPPADLKALAQADELPAPIVSPVAVAAAEDGSRRVAYAVDDADSLAAFTLPDLARSVVRQLNGRCVWGPRPMGDRVMLATEDGWLICLGAEGEIVWQSPLPYGPLAGEPLKNDQSYILAAAGGAIWRIDSQTGRQVGPAIETGRPVATGPVALDDHLLLGGSDGTLYRVGQP